jgi:hypothetical protein
VELTSESKKLGLALMKKFKKSEIFIVDNKHQYFSKRNALETANGDESRIAILTAEAEKAPEGEPTADWKVDQIKAFLTSKEIDFTGVKSKEDLLALLVPKA